jgi:hypothetical protein
VPRDTRCSDYLASRLNVVAKVPSATAMNPPARPIIPEKPTQLQPSAPVSSVIDYRRAGPVPAPAALANAD